jgi:glycosyltransferase involved in cell wall biosynthesis
MRLGFHYHIPAYQVDGKIFTIAFQGVFLDSLAEQCSKLVLYMYKPSASEMKELDYELTSKNVELVSLMEHFSIPKRIMLYRSIRKTILKMPDQIDILLVRAPTPLLPLITKDIKGKIPFSYLVVGEMSKHVDDIKQPEWRKSLIRIYVRWNESKQERYAKQALIFANSKLTYDKYKLFSKECVEIRTTTLKKSDFFVRKDTCQNKPINILYTGRIEQDKGLLEITEAIGILNKQGYDCMLNIVGWALPNDNTESLMNEIADRFNIRHKIIFNGFKKVGEELFKFYKDADLFIVASQNNEGFPRTIWESLAHSVPVITVPVGSIPLFLKDEFDCLFIKRKDANDITEKIKRLIESPELRQKLIMNGLDTVKEVTLEIQSKKMIDHLKKYLHA